GGLAGGGDRPLRRTRRQRPVRGHRACPRPRPRLPDRAPAGPRSAGLRAAPVLPAGVAGHLPARAARPRARLMAAPPPAALVALDKARLLAGTQVLLDDVSVGIGDGDRIGVVGRNGGGKTSLLSVVRGTRELDAGRVVR